MAINEVTTYSPEKPLESLTSFILTVAGNVCGICALIGHQTDNCPVLQEGFYERVNITCEADSFSSEASLEDVFKASMTQMQQFQIEADSFSSEASLEDVFKASMTQMQQFQIQTQQFQIQMQIETQQFQIQMQQFQIETQTSLHNLENQISQLAPIIDRIVEQRSKKLPSQIMVKPKENESDKEFQEAVTRNLKRPHFDGEENCEVVHKKSKIGPMEENDEDDQALNSNGIKTNPIVPYVQQFQNFEEYYRVDFGKVKNLDEFKFGGDHQSYKDAMEIKEMTTRRHEMTIFMIEPD